jgi:nicotinamidase-related amidase
MAAEQGETMVAPPAGRARQPEAAGGDHEPTYVLITQCLQNDFLFNLNCRLGLPADAAGKLLVHPASERSFGENRSRRTLDAGTIRRGPMARLLTATVGQRLTGAGPGTLHLVNIRDWHTDGEHYDRERRLYGPHCEAGTWGADYPAGLLGLLDPAGTRRQVGDPRGERCGWDPAGARRGTVVVHHVHSNTLFDLEGRASGGRSELEEVLDQIITPENRGDVRVAVVGVYTDIKVQIVLQSLRIAYNPSRLVVSDSLTASPTLDRHLAALDFAQKVLWAEVMHGVGDLARYLGSDPGEDEELESSASEIAYADYAQYFRDKQSIISYEDAQLRSYRQQITGRLRRTVRLVNFTSSFLIGSGIVTLGSSVVLAALSAVHAGRLPVALPAALLGLSVVQLVSIFFNRPVRELTSVLSREAVFRMLLESRSLRLALARYHLTTPEALRGDASAGAQADVVRDQLNLLIELDNVDFDRFAGFSEPLRDGRKPDGPES